MDPVQARRHDRGTLVARDLGYGITILGVIAMTVAFALDFPNAYKAASGAALGMGVLLVAVAASMRTRVLRDNGSPYAKDYVFGWKDRNGGNVQPFTGASVARQL